MLDARGRLAMTVAVHHHVMPSGVLGFAVRIARGAAHNFAIRVSDWFSACVMTTFGLLLMHWREVFEVNRYFGVLEQFASAHTWGMLCTAVGLARIAALTINGTFPLFRWSPHLRFVMAAIGVFLWFQITLGLLLSSQPTMAMAAYPHLFVFDMYNLFLAASEAGVAERRYRDGRR